MSSTAKNNNNNVESEFEEITDKDEWPTLFQRIRTQSINKNYVSAEAVKPQNKELNRYRDVSPYDHSRIILKKGATDYINANLVKVERAQRSYILTQGPLVITISHFWLMVWEQNSKAVIMLNKLIEKKQEKCTQYWPPKPGPDHALKLDDVGLRVEYTDYGDYSYYLTRTFKITDVDSKETREIKQFHYTTWPDFGVPGSPTMFLEFLRKIRAEGVLDASVGPSIVHCSAGIGRSGTFCLVDSVLVLVEKYGENTVDVKQILLEMRNYRMGLIQTHEQLRFSYQAIIEGIKKLKCADSENCNDALSEAICGDAKDPDRGGVVRVSCVESTANDDDIDEDEPPPLPPPRGDSLTANRPLPMIPTSASMNEFDYDVEPANNKMGPCPSGPLPVLPPVNDDVEGSSEDELEDEDDDDEDDDEDYYKDVEDSSPVHKAQVEVTNSLNRIDSNSTNNHLTRRPPPPIPSHNHAESEADVASPGSDSDTPPPPPNRNTSSESPRATADAVVTAIDSASKTEKATTATKRIIDDVASNDDDDSSSDHAPDDDVDDEDDAESAPASPINTGAGCGNSSEAAELRQRRRAERSELLAAQVRDMKRRQQANEQWRQLKRSLRAHLRLGSVTMGAAVSAAVLAAAAYVTYQYYTKS